MCLSRIDNTLKKTNPNYKLRRGWKIFNIRQDGTIEFENFAHNHSLKIKGNKWLTTDKRKLIKTDKQQNYRPYFHIYLFKPLENFAQITLPVRFRQPTVTGYQFNDRPCVIAKKIFIEKT